MIPQNNAPLQNQTYTTLKEMILSNRFDPGTLYSETRLSNELGVSRTPMREALHYLSQEGYITILPSRGFRIRQLNLQDMKETIEMRCAIEGFCIFKIINTLKENASGTEELVESLAKSIDEQKKALALTDPENRREEFMKADFEYHNIIVSFSNNEQFISTYQRLSYLIRLTTQKSLCVPGRMESTFEEHQTLFHNIVRKNSTAAGETLVSHLMAPLSLHLQGE